MEVVAVSKGVPQWQDINGTRTWTSIIHTTLPSLRLTKTGVEGNKLAAHDAQVYAFFSQHYDYWAKRLGVPRDSWDYGHWGENITFRSATNLTEDDCRLGDVWQIGDEVQLQVCGARVPCSKLSWRCGQKDQWLAELAGTGWSGVYLRVLREGTIEPGDRAVLVTKYDHTATVASITQLAFDTSLKSKDTMNLLVQEPDLLSMNKSIFTRKLSMMHDKEVVGRNHWSGWRSFRPLKIVQECQDVKSFYLIPRDRLNLGTYLPGQFLSVRLPNGTTRNWSISDWLDHDHPKHYRLSIRRSGKASQWMHDHCTLETTLLVRAPVGAFHLDWSPLVLGRQIYISAGIGITPIVSMLKAHLTHSAMRKAPAVWFHVAKDGDNFPIGMYEELETLYDKQLRESDILQMHLYLTNSNASPYITKALTKIATSIAHARPRAEDLHRLISPSYSINPLDIVPIEVPGAFSTAYICGPSQFESSMKSALTATGLAPGMIRTESFAAGLGSSSKVGQLKSKVTFTLSDLTVDWTSSSLSSDGSQPASLLDLAETSGLTPTFGCRVGLCGSCRVKLASGSVSGGLQPDGSVLICSATPASGCVALDL